MNVLGSFCLKPLIPTRSIPQGDPTSPNVLAQILRPWHAIVHLKHPMVRTWAYCDDRSLRCSGTLEDLNDALASTRRFDDDVGFSENMKKRQIWANNDVAEHLGLSVCPASQDLPTLRNGWDAIADNFLFLQRFLVASCPARMPSVFSSKANPYFLQKQMDLAGAFHCTPTCFVCE